VVFFVESGAGETQQGAERLAGQTKRPGGRETGQHNSIFSFMFQLYLLDNEQFGFIVIDK